MTVVVRQAAEMDLPRLLDLYCELNPEDAVLSLASASMIWTAMVAQHGRSVLVADLDGTLAGAVDCTVSPNLTRGGRSILNVDNVIVAQAFRRRGIGRRLMDGVWRLAEDANCYKIQLLAADAPEAHSFYRACGYEPLAQGFRRYLRAPVQLSGYPNPPLAPESEVACGH